MIKKKKKNFIFLKQTYFSSITLYDRGNYLEPHKEVAGGNLYYTDYKRKTLISVFCVAGNCCRTISTNINWEKVK